MGLAPANRIESMKRLRAGRCLSRFFHARAVIGS